MSKSFGNQLPQDNTNIKNLDDLQIFLVDDDVDTLILMTAVLEDYGVQVRTATSVSEALGVIRNFELDFLIIDIAMPEEDGYSLIGKVRALEDIQKRKIPAIALTALDTEEARQLAFKCGFQSYLTKPFDSNELVTQITKILASSVTNPTSHPERKAWDE